MPAPLYARYVPPKAAKPKLKESPVPLPPNMSPPPKSIVPLPVSLTESPVDKRKKRKRTIEQPYPVEEPVQEVNIKSEDAVVKASKPKKEKAKKRKRDIEQPEQAEEESNDTVSKKHKAVLSKFERSSKFAEVIRSEGGATSEKQSEDNTAKEELHDLVPLPQPTPVPEAPYQPTFSDLPPWLAKPIVVPSDRHTPFHELGVDAKLIAKLEKKGYHNALAVQSQIIPMLRPGLEQHLGDLCVLAKTGSGKTMAYLLPMIESMKDRDVTKLSVIIVVPTRILVNQARAVADELCVGTKLKVGVAIGDVSLATERKALVNVRGRFDLERAKELHDKANEQMKTGFVERGGILDDLMTMLPGHVSTYESKVDILICTPGRLVEHIESTTGFLLRDVQWVVFDEADQLLDHGFHDWANTFMDALHGDTPPDFMNAREKCCMLKRRPVPRSITKVILSATLTKDLTKVHTLRLQRPKLVVVQDETSAEDKAAGADDVSYELPSTLHEFAVPVGDGLNKPLYLLYLLQKKILWESNLHPAVKTESESDSSSDSDLDESTSSSDSDSSSGEDVEASYLTLKHPHEKTKKLSPPNEKESVSNKRVLVFTKSNENAARLARVLSLLDPTLANQVAPLTKTATSKKSKKLLKLFSEGNLPVLVASDRASRGLDIPDLTHVINYDIPHDVTSYVHRVGRTARAEKQGEALTLFTTTEAHWFFHEIAGGNTIKRGTRVVERVKLDKQAVLDGKEEAYQAALASLQDEVQGDTAKAKDC
jgi:ATP-dependent RNA helicase DDX51/DBP6